MPQTTINWWNFWHTLALVVILGIIVAIPILSSLLQWPLAKGNPTSSLLTWLVMLVLLTAFVVLLGHAFTRRVLGVLIDGRNKMSLSRLQLVVWIILVLSALLTAALWNLSFSIANPLNITLPSSVLLLLGISTTSLVGAPLILNTTKTAAPNASQAQRQIDLTARQRAGIPPQKPPAADQQERFSQQKELITRQLTLQGRVVGFKQPDQASLADLFRGDEVGNFAQLDLSKVQLFFFTLIVVLIYAVSLGKVFAKGEPITDFPPLEQSIIVAMVISHASYLTYKAVPHSAPPEQGGTPQATATATAQDNKGQATA